MNMKTRYRIWLGLVVACWLTLPRAQAFYNPATGRWLTRDPIGERAGKSLLCFLSNAAQLGVDPLGLACFSCINGSAPESFSQTRGAWPPTSSAIIPAIDRQSQYGVTVCYPWDPINDPPTVSNKDTGCTRGCTEEHEQVHATDRAECCKKYRKAYQAAGANQQALITKWRDYVGNSKNWAECRAYHKSVECLTKLEAEKHCACPEGRQGNETCCKELETQLKYAKQSVMDHCYASPGDEGGDPDGAPACPAF